MKFNINGYSQEKLIENGLDVTDALILRVLADMYVSNSKNFEIIENERYMWITYDYIIKQIPILGSSRTLKRRFENYVEKDVLKKIVLTSKKGVKGKYMFITFGENYSELTEYKRNEEPSDKMSPTKCQNVTDQVTKCHIKDSSNNNYSNNNKKDKKIDRADSQNNDTLKTENNPSIDFKNDLLELKDIVEKATGQPRQYIDATLNPMIFKNKFDLKELIKKINESDFLLGKLEVKPNLNNFSVYKMLVKIMADTYRNKINSKQTELDSIRNVNKIEHVMTEDNIKELVEMGLLEEGDWNA